MKVVFKALMLISMIFILSCDKANISQRPMSQIEISNCHNELQWSDVKIRNALIGKWKWIYSESYWAYGEGWNTESENTLIEFFNDSSLNITVNGELESTTKWITIPKDGELYGLELDSSITTLIYGRILICGDIVEFNNSYIDGSDNYFTKIE